MLEFISSKMFYMPLFYIIGGILVYMMIAKAINGVSSFNIKGNVGLDKRKITIVSLVKNIIKYIIAIIVITMILNLYGVNTTGIIASLGAVSVIIGLAFQDIIKDFLAGVFIIFDNEYAVGDWVEINGFSGEIVSFGLKTTKIKAYTGEVKMLSNSSFTEVTNYSLNPTILFMEVPFGYEVKLEVIEEILNNVLNKIKKEKNVRKVELLGVNSFEDSYLKYAFTIECNSMTHYGIRRETLKLIKLGMEEKGISIPYNKIDITVKK